MVYGAGKAAEESGDLAVAKDYYEQLVALQGSSPSSRDRALYANKMAMAK
jgi:hypothetical protein